MAAVKISQNPLHLYTEDSLREILPCFIPARWGRAETPKLADRGLIELKDGDRLEWLAVDDESLTIFTRAGSRLFELSDRCADAQAASVMKLYRYVFSKSDFPEPMPKRVGRAVVERFLREFLGRGYTGAMMQLALFYDAQAVVPDLLTRLDARETTEDEVRASIMLAETVGVLGDDAQRGAGRRYYRRLLTLPYGYDSAKEFRIKILLDCYAAYAPEEPSEGLRGRIDESLARLRAHAATDPAAAGPLMRQVEYLRGVTLSRVEGAAAMKREIMQTPDPAKRLDALVNINLEIDARYSEFVDAWACNRLVRASRAGGAGSVVAAFRRALARLRGDRSPEAHRARALALRAVEYFGGECTPAERALARTAQWPYVSLWSFE
ncbi:MAG: hypothetical protein M3444_03910 [Acidobacteriota bacterium]|nr:hypothetical protein [Acidobacteriota bacterium]MDQ5836529.1 hypothetical protein [Acidobacteriota bacterium]